MFYFLSRYSKHAPWSNTGRKCLLIYNRKTYITVRGLLKPGPPRQWKPIREPNCNSRFEHFQIQPIRGTIFNFKQSNVQYKTMKSQLVRCDAYAIKESSQSNAITVSVNKLPSVNIFKRSLSSYKCQRKFEMSELEWCYFRCICKELKANLEQELAWYKNEFFVRDKFDFSIKGKFLWVRLLFLLDSFYRLRLR